MFRVIKLNMDYLSSGLFGFSQKNLGGVTVTVMNR